MLVQPIFIARLKPRICSTQDTMLTTLSNYHLLSPYAHIIKIFFGGDSSLLGQCCVTQYSITSHYTLTLNNTATKASNLINHSSFKIRQSEGESYLYSVPKVITQFVHADVNTVNLLAILKVYDILNIDTYLSWSKTEIIFTWARGSSGALESWSWSPLMTLSCMRVSIGTFLNCWWWDFR